MRVFITGGAGFVGSQLANRLLQEDHTVVGIGRSSRPGAGFPASVKYLSGDTTRPGAWQQEVRDADVIINLAGVSIFGRWTKEKKKQVYESRILTTRNLVDSLGPERNVIFVSASAVGYFGSAAKKDFTEDDGPGDDFLAGVSRDWEAEAIKARERNARVVITRYGVVLDKSGGALGQMIPAFKAFLGGPLGNGSQPFSWLHMQDLIEATIFLMKRGNLEGPFNFTSPNPVSNRELAKTLGEVLHRPSILPAPAFALKLALGEFGSFLLEGQRVLPKRLMEAGYRFRYPYLKEALHEVIQGA
jgi:uncharacterized protein (TIGR01777 family)